MDSQHSGLACLAPVPLLEPDLSVFFDITHTTHYRYAQPVGLGEHKVLFRPRDSHDLRVLATDLVVTPTPVDIRLMQDAYSNSVALVQPQSPSTELKVVCSFSVEHTGTRALDVPLSPRAQTYPVNYKPEEQIALSHYFLPYYDDPDGSLQAWASQFIDQSGATDSRQLLVEMTRHIRDTMQYRARFDEGVQTPYETLRLQSGTCRDFCNVDDRGNQAFGLRGPVRLRLLVHALAGRHHKPGPGCGCHTCLGAGVLAGHWLDTI